MKKVKAILIVVILCGLVCMYYDNIVNLINNWQTTFSQSSYEYVPETDKSSYEYYFKSYTENY